MNPLSPEIRLTGRDMSSRMFIPSGGGKGAEGGGGGGGSVYATSGRGGGFGGGGGGVGASNTAAGRLSSIINAVQSSNSNINTNTLPIIR